MRRVRLLLLLAIALAPALVAVPARAHSDLVRSVPSAAAELTEVPSTVTLEFNEDVHPRLATVTLLVGGDDLGELVVQQGERPAELIADVPIDQLPVGPGGPTWTVSYRVTSADGHPIEGQFEFTAPLPASAPSAAPSTPTADTSQPAPAPGQAEPASPQGDDDPASDQTAATVTIGLLAAIGAVGGCVLLVRARRRANGS